MYSICVCVCVCCIFLYALCFVELKIQCCMSVAGVIEWGGDEDEDGEGGGHLSRYLGLWVCICAYEEV